MYDGFIRITGTTTFFKKYVFSIILIVLGISIYIWSSKGFFAHVILIVFVAIGIFFFRLSELYYNKDQICLGKSKFEYKDLEYVRIFELDIYQYLVFKFKKDGKIKWYVVDPGKLGILSIIRSIFSDQSSLRKLEAFLKLMKEKDKN